MDPQKSFKIEIFLLFYIVILRKLFRMYIVVQTETKEGKLQFFQPSLIFSAKASVYPEGAQSQMVSA